MNKRTENTFQLQFPAAELPEFASCYPAADDKKALDAGRRIRAGHYTRGNLEEIVKWKSRRPLPRLLRNTDSEIAEALKLASAAECERTALAVLTGLNGIQVPVASAVLTCIDPVRYTVIDFRALEALGVIDENMTINFYLDYLEYCRDLATANKIELRNLDRALWKWSEEKSKSG